MEEKFIFTIDTLNIQSNDLYTYYQPLYRLDNQTLFSYESLLRCKGNTPPDVLFDTARLESKVNILDRTAIERGMSTYSKYNSAQAPLLFLNILPSTLLQEDFFEFLHTNLEKTGIPANQLVFEISESASEAKNWDMVSLKKSIYTLREKGIQIAIDDVGTGIACNKKIIEFEPDFVKLDKYFGMGLSASLLKQSTVQMYVFLCKGTSKVILEGIETEEDLKLAKSLGVDIGQGYFLGKPEPLT